MVSDPEPLLWNELQAMAPEAVSELPLDLNPGTAVIRSAWPIIDIRNLKDKSDDEVSLEVEGRPSIALVYRYGCKPAAAISTKKTPSSSKRRSVARAWRRSKPPWWRMARTRSPSRDSWNAFVG